MFFFVCFSFPCMYLDKINCFSEIVIYISNVLIVGVFRGFYLNVLVNYLFMFFVLFTICLICIIFWRKKNILEENIFQLLFCPKFLISLTYSIFIVFFIFYFSAMFNLSILNQLPSFLAVQYKGSNVLNVRKFVS